MDFSTELNFIDEALKMWSDKLGSQEPYYSSIRSKVADLMNNPSYPQHQKLKLKEIYWHIESIAGKSDGNGHSIEQHFVWAYSVISALRI